MTKRTDTGLTWKGLPNGQTWDNLDIKNDCNGLKQIKYIKQTNDLPLEVAWALSIIAKLVNKGKEST